MHELFMNWLYRSQGNIFEYLYVISTKFMLYTSHNCFKYFRLDMPELLWKSYIDFEVAQDETENARQLFERLLERTLHVKVSSRIISNLKSFDYSHFYFIFKYKIYIPFRFGSRMRNSNWQIRCQRTALIMSFWHEEYSSVETMRSDQAAIRKAEHCF